jgi:hypothetical protein
MPIGDHRAAFTASKAVTVTSTCGTVSILTILLQPGLSYAGDRPQGYPRDMRIVACIVAENAVRARLQEEWRIGFESCASDKFDIDLAIDDRAYQVRGYGTLLSPNAGSVNKRFMVRIIHTPASYGDWGFKVTAVEINP